MNNSTYPNNPQEAIFMPVQNCPYHVTFDLDFDLKHILWMQAYVGTIVFKFGRDAVICPREEAICMYIMYIVTKGLQYFAPASGRINDGDVVQTIYCLR